MIVIADDMTGAAEIAGLAFAKGQQVKLVCSTAVCGCDTVTDETIVIATDSRSMTEAEAIAETRRIGIELKDSTPQPPGFSVFKKTDSALRGHVVAELTALMQATGYERAVYLPANPSKGRIIRDGIYYINDIPIHQTAFSYDPEFPAHTSNLRERFPDAETHHIIMPDAQEEADIRRIVTEYHDGKTLFAGAADLFSHGFSRSFTEMGLPPRPAEGRLQGKNPYPTEGGLEGTLFLCGSTQSKPLNIGIPVSPMPREIYDGATDLNLWNVKEYYTQHSLILTIPHIHHTDKATATHLRTMMARMAKRLIATHRPEHLVIEGGATAWAALQALGWKDFTIVGQLAPGVVQMCADCGTLVTLKPGSYPWTNAQCIIHNT